MVRVVLMIIIVNNLSPVLNWIVVTSDLVQAKNNNLTMACTYKAPNGELSDLFDQVYNGWGKPNAVKVWTAIQSEQFKDWYGEGKTDTNGEPAINEYNEFVSAAGETLHVSEITGTVLNSPSAEKFAEQLNTLTNVFERAGLNIEVTFDESFDNIGSVITVNGVTKLTFNPRLIQSDSILHEFGHIYIDMLGMNHPVIKRGIEHVKGTPLWNKIANQYPELSGDKLAKEVLTTAVGMEAAALFDERVRIRKRKGTRLVDKIKGLANWFKGLFEAIAEKFGITNNAVQKLAFDLTSGNLRYTLTHKSATYAQFMKVKPDINLLKAESSRLKLTEDENHYKIDNDEARLLRRATTAIEDIKGKFDRESVISYVAKSDKPEYADYKTEDDVARLWADKREEGTGLHLINEIYIEVMGPEGKGDREAAIKKILDNLHKPAPGVDEHGVRLYSGMSEELVRGYVENIADYLDFLYSKGYKLYAEIKVFDEEMGVAGTIDLLIQKPNGNWMIYDFKTKEVGKFDSFYTVNKEGGFTGMEGIASNVENTTANGYALQLSTYALILKRKGFNVTDMGIIPFEGVIEQQGDEFRYKNVKLFKDATTIRNSDNVLPVSDLTKTMEEVYLIKDDIEQQLENAETATKDVGEMLDELSELSKTREWLEDTILNIKKSIARLRATADVTTATRYEREVKKLIDKLMVEDEMMAITAYTEYIGRGLTTLYGKFFDKFDAREDDNGDTYREYIKGYDSYTWQDISELEKNDPKAYMEFLGFLINADMFLNQAITVQKLPFTDARQSNLVLKALKANEGRITDLKLKINRLNKELDMRYVELSSNPLYGGRGVLQNSAEFFKAQADENFAQRHFDALADTHNSYMANVIRLYDYKMRYMEDEINSYTNKWKDMMDELKKEGIPISRFIDKETAKVIPIIDYQRYYQDRSEMFKRVDKHYNNKRDWKWRNSVNTWLRQNTVLLNEKERKALGDKMRLELGDDGYADWIEAHTYESKSGTRNYKLTSPFYKPNPETYGNKTYNSYSTKEKEFHADLNKMLAELTDHTKSSIIKQGYLPAVPLNEDGAIQQVVKGLGWRESGTFDMEKGVVVNELGEVVHFLPFGYNNLLQQEKYEKVDKNADEATKRDVSQRNAEKRERNKKAHAAAVNQDLDKTMPIFIREVLKNKHKKAMEFELLRVKKSFLENHKIKLTKNGKPVIDKYKKMNGFVDNHVEKTTQDSKILKHYEDWMRMVFYEQFENDEGHLQKVARVMQNYTSFKGMAFNILSSVNNQTYGSLMSQIEAAAASYFSKEDWNKFASMEYATGLKSFMFDEADSPSSKQSAFIQYFSIMMDFKEQAIGNENTNLSNRMLQKASWAFSKAYMFEHASEHYLQNKTLFAMAHSHRLVDGLVITFDEFKRGKLQKITLGKDGMTKAEAKKAIAANKAQEKKLREQFEKHKRLYELFDFKDGKLEISDKVSKEEIAEFERKVIGVNQYLHGIYNKEDAGTMQQYAVGRLAVQFRKWMRPGWNKRFGNRFGEKYWNERRSIMEEGMYVTTAKFFATPMLHNWSEYMDKKGTKEAIGMGQLISSTVKDMARFLVNIRLHWHTLNDQERANVKRTLLEYAAFCTAVGLVTVAKSMKGDDDEPPYALLLTLYQLDRTATELTTYVPLAIAPGFIGGGWFNEAKKLLKSPAATFGTMEAIIKLGKNILAYPFIDEEETMYQGGVYSGESKINVQIQKLIPIWNQTQRLAHLAQNYKYYKLF